uniref:Uncharacterized protein n=1 Tax=Ananas comosus var. bracteatus TaxID=296719 RepID=A0A6V7NYY8_ANACO|nr:unnamed protein product [Ananas comosus var. bracteatus]
MAPQYSNENNGSRVPVVVVHHGNLTTSHADGHGSLLRKDPYGTPWKGRRRWRRAPGMSTATAFCTAPAAPAPAPARTQSSSSSEGGGQGRGRKNSSLKSKIKEKLPGGRKNGVGHAAKPSGGVEHTEAWGTTTTTTTATANGGPREKKGFMEKIKEKLPGHN